jgi:holo-[acyl-carrier protein] synthase
MIFGVGIDLVNIPRMEAVLHRWGDRFVKRVFTEQEAQSLLSKGLSGRIFCPSICRQGGFLKGHRFGDEKGESAGATSRSCTSPEGRPAFKLKGKSAETCREKGITRLHLSLSDEGRYGSAVVILEEKG